MAWYSTGSRSRTVDSATSYADAVPCRDLNVGSGQTRDDLLAFNAALIRCFPWFSGVAHHEMFIDGTGNVVFFEIAGRPGGGVILASATRPASTQRGRSDGPARRCTNPGDPCRAAHRLHDDLPSGRHSGGGPAGPGRAVARRPRVSPPCRRGAGHPNWPGSFRCPAG